MDQQLNGVPTNEDLLRAALLEPPQYLVDLRSVYNGMDPRTPAQQKLKTLWDDDTDKFLSRLAAAEKDYRAGQKGGGLAPADGPDPVEPDKNTERIEAQIQRLLGEAAWDAEQEREECAKLAAKMGADPAIVAAIRKRKQGPNA